VATEALFQNSCLVIFYDFFSVVVGTKNMADLLPKCIKIAIKQQTAKK